MMVTIAADKEEAASTRASVEAQEAEATAQAGRARDIAADAQRDLDEALPALDAALASLKNLSRSAAAGRAWRPGCNRGILLLRAPLAAGALARSICRCKGTDFSRAQPAAPAAPKSYAA
jgi:hypothetical protein